MQVSRPPLQVLQPRLDPQYYAPENIVNDQRINALAPEPLDSLRDPAVRMSYGVLKPEFVDSPEYRLARIQNFLDPFLNLDACVGISQPHFLKFKRSECLPGDILIAIAGYVGRAALVPTLNCRLNINQHIARFRPHTDERIDPYFLITYLISTTGKRQIQRWVSGSVQAGINLEDLRLLPIPSLQKAAQCYIGNKVRQAELLRASSEQAMRLARQLIEALISRAVRDDDVKKIISGVSNPNDVRDLSFGLPSMTDRNREGRRSLISRISGIALTERLDSGFYQKEFLENERLIHECGLALQSIGTLSERCNCGATRRMWSTTRLANHSFGQPMSAQTSS